MAPNRGVLLGKNTARQLVDLLQRDRNATNSTPGKNPGADRGGNRILLALAAESIGIGASGSVTIATGATKGEETESTTRTVTAYNRFGPPLSVGDFCLVTRAGGSGWEILPGGGSSADGSGACPCVKGSGYAEPTTSKFTHKLNRAWTICELRILLGNVTGFTIGSDQELGAYWDHAEPSNGWISDPLERSISDGEGGTLTDLYVLTVTEDEDFSLKATFSRVVDEDDEGPNCLDEIYWVWVCLHPHAASPTHNNQLVILDAETKTSEDASTYIDPPTSQCFPHLVRHIGYSTQICNEDYLTLVNEIQLDINGTVSATVDGVYFTGVPSYPDYYFGESDGKNWTWALDDQTTVLNAGLNGPHFLTLQPDDDPDSYLDPKGRVAVRSYRLTSANPSGVGGSGTGIGSEYEYIGTVDTTMAQSGSPGTTRTVTLDVYKDVRLYVQCSVPGSLVEGHGATLGFEFIFIRSGQPLATGHRFGYYRSRSYKTWDDGGYHFTVYEDLDFAESDWPLYLDQLQWGGAPAVFAKTGWMRNGINSFASPSVTAVQVKAI